MKQKIDNDYDFLRYFLWQITGVECSLAIASGRWGEATWQVMADPPHEEYDFFNWYCWKYPDTQFYENIYETVIRYLYHRNEWIKLGKPKWDANV